MTEFGHLAKSHLAIWSTVTWESFNSVDWWGTKSVGKRTPPVLRSCYPSKREMTLCRESTPIISMDWKAGSRSTLLWGRTQRLNPNFEASLTRTSVRPTARTSPVRPISPRIIVWGSTGLSRKLEATAVAIARSTAGSSTRTPPAALTKISWWRRGYTSFL